jgi:hypothetical protein
MADGLKRYTHEERRRIVESLIPLIKRHVGKDLVALAVTGSFSRETDGAYSDVELVGFVKKEPASDRNGMKFVYNGLLIDLWFITPALYLHRHRQKINLEWPYSGSSTLTPLLNEPLIRKINETPLNISLEERLKVVKNYWPDVQEAAAKVLTAAGRGDAEAVPFLFWQVAEKICVVLSLINGRPFITRAGVFCEVRTFDILPKHAALLSFMPDAQVTSAELANRVQIIFGEVEQILYSFGLDPYVKELDFFVSPLSVGNRIARKLKIDWGLRKAGRVLNALKLKCLRIH